MKKIISVFLAVILSAGIFTACGRNKDKDNSPSALPETENSSSLSEPVPSQSYSGMPENSVDENNNPGDAGSSLRPSEAQNRDLDEFAAALKEKFGTDYLPDTVMDNREIEELTGISPDMYVDMYGEKSSFVGEPDIFIAVKAKEDKKDEVKNKLEEYKEKMVAEGEGEAYLERLGYAQIMEQDNYVFFYLLGKSDFGESNENIGDKIGEEIKKAEEVIKNMLS